MDELTVGEVVTLRSSVTDNLITHRITQVTATGPGSAEIRMQGDANQSEDGETYGVSGTVWRPAVQISGGGYALMRVTNPSVALPLLMAIGALIAMTLLPSRPADGGSSRVRSTTDSTSTNSTTSHSATAPDTDRNDMEAYAE